MVCVMESNLHWLLAGSSGEGSPSGSDMATSKSEAGFSRGGSPQGRP